MARSDLPAYVISGGPWLQGKVGFNVVFESSKTSLVKLCRMKFLRKARIQLLWNVTLVKKNRGHSPVQQIL